MRRAHHRHRRDDHQEAVHEERPLPGLDHLRQLLRHAHESRHLRVPAPERREDRCRRPSNNERYAGVVDVVARGRLVDRLGPVRPVRSGGAQPGTELRGRLQHRHLEDHRSHIHLPLPVLSHRHQQGPARQPRRRSHHARHLSHTHLQVCRQTPQLKYQAAKEIGRGKGRGCRRTGR